MKFVIIGGDAAGMSAASKSKRNNPNIEVTVLEKSQDVSYSACGMPYNIADPNRSMDDLIVRTADEFRSKNRINLLTGHRVDKIDPVGKTVSGISFENGKESQTFSYQFDKLLIATGAAPIIPNIYGVNLSGVMPLKSLEDGRAIKSFIDSNLNSKPVKKAVIIGIGYIGLEMCEALKERSIDVFMVKPSEQFLPSFASELADVVKQELVDKSVNLYCGYNIDKIEQNSNLNSSSLVVVCKNRASNEIVNLDADMVIVASGVKPCSQIAIEAGLEIGISGAVAVDKNLKTSDENIYAAGDCADAFHVVTDKKCWIPLALRANRAGWAVADNVCGINTTLPGVAGTAVFKIFDLQVARTGLTVKEALEFGFEPAQIVIQSRSKAHGHPGSKTIHVSMVGDKKTGLLLGVQMVGKDGVVHRINAAAVALHAKMRVVDFAQCDLAYAPPFGPVWDPLLTAANQLIKKLG
ncbi:MAG: FAD-dependent oxidoreductase [Desulfamplus sp.]|nr:FAD-dependent oxidoreductase [Desulfamplus sp.]